MKVLTRKLIELTDVGKIDWEIAGRGGNRFVFQTKIDEIRIQVWSQKKGDMDTHASYKISLQRGETSEERTQGSGDREEMYIRDLYQMIKQWVEEPPGKLEGELLDGLIKRAGFQQKVLVDHGEKEPNE